MMRNYLSQRRRELGLTQKEVADAVGVSEATVSRWESGEIANMRRDRIVSLARILNCSADFIMNGNDGESENPSLSAKRKPAYLQRNADNTRVFLYPYCRLLPASIPVLRS